MIQPWPKLSSNALADYKIFQIRTDSKRSPRTGQPHSFYVIECVNWVNVVALTPRRELVMIEQYRHGTDTVELEIPGGMMDPTDPSPAAAGARELREETGYDGSSSRVIGEVFPNPAIMNNRCYTVLVEECALTHPTSWDHAEDIATQLVPVKDLPDLLRTGKIRHSLVVAALFHFQLAASGAWS